ncbi:MAG: methyltransferase domain-containing protein [Actinomycetota bacterium]|nr:methyltransferase domain-containing protein [Actinomycetota bacterium]
MRCWRRAGSARRTWSRSSSAAYADAISDVARSFARVAPAYERSRPSYPKDAVAWLGRRLGLAPGRVVLDLAAGTGKLTRQLVPFGAEVLAVEPLHEMRAELAHAVPGVTPLEGTAEAIPLADASVDAVTVGQAFHWFDGPVAVKEIHRVLRAGGGVGLLWNALADDEVGRAAEAVRGQLVERSSDETWSRAFTGELFLPLEQRTFEFRERLAREDFIERFSTISVVAALDEDERLGALEDLRARLPDDPLTAAYTTEVYVAEARAR